MTREINPFGLRMPNELKEQLEREAKFNGRSLNSELVDRLRKSLEPAIRSGNNTVNQPSANYAPELTETERQLLSVFRRMPPEKQLALLSLFN